MVQRNRVSKRRATNLISRFAGSLIIALVVVLFSAHMSAQTGGEAGIQGAVTDSSRRFFLASTRSKSKHKASVTTFRET